MYGVIRRYNTHPGMGRNIAKLVRDDFVPQLRKLPSFVGYYVLTAEDDTMASISLFRDKKAADESNHMAAEWVRRNIASMVKTAPVILSGEVSVQYLADGGSSPEASRPVTTRSEPRDASFR